MSKAANLAGFATAVSPPNNLTVGIITATTITGNLTGTATGLTGTPNITVGFITATGASISGNVTVGGNVSIAGTLTYEDVTNVDSIGIVTARSGVNVTGGSVVVGSAVTLSSGGVNVNSGSVVVGSAVTLSSGGITVGVVTATRVSVAASVTATNFYGDGSQLTGVGGAAAVTVLTTNTTLTKGNAYMINASGVVLTLPASPSTGDAVDILNNVSGIHTLARNGSTIMSLSEDMTFGEAGVKFKVWYTGSTWSLF